MQQMLILSFINPENPHLPLATSFMKLGCLQRFASLLLLSYSWWLVGRKCLVESEGIVKNEVRHGSVPLWRDFGIRSFVRSMVGVSS